MMIFEQQRDKAREIFDRGYQKVSTLTIKIKESEVSSRTSTAPSDC
jgi:hypothetical protein